MKEIVCLPARYLPVLTRQVRGQSKDLPRRTAPAMLTRTVASTRHADRPPDGAPDLTLASAQFVLARDTADNWSGLKDRVDATRFQQSRRSNGSPMTSSTPATVGDLTARAAHEIFPRQLIRRCAQGRGTGADVAERRARVAHFTLADAVSGRGAFGLFCLGRARGECLGAGR